MVAENWTTYGWVSGSSYNCGAYSNQEQAIISIIDISDPAGKIRLHTKFETYGQIDDQFKQTYFFDDKTKKAYYMASCCAANGARTTAPALPSRRTLWSRGDVTDGAAPQIVARLPFGKQNETVRGSVFDPDRSVAFAITARNVDPLYALSYADPAQPKILSAIDA